MGGGVFTYIVDLANELVNDFDMYIAYATRPQTPSNYKQYFDKRIHLIRVQHFNRSLRPLSDFMAMQEIKQIAGQVQPDIIHLHSSKAGVLGRVAFNGKKVPLFYTPHAYSFLMMNHSLPKRIMFKEIEKLCAKKNCTTISCSAGEHEETLKMTRRAAYVNNGINRKELQELLDGIQVETRVEPRLETQEKYKVFTLGRICHQKNPALFNQIALAMPDEKFLWIGDGDLRGVLTASNITVTGWGDRREALKLSQQGEVFVLTSLWEGLPISLLEAMYMKKLCVVSDVIGNRDVIKNGVNGYVCHSVEDFVKGIKTGGNQLIAQAYNDVLDEYNTAVMGEKYSRLYLRALARRNRIETPEKTGGGGYYGKVVCFRGAVIENEVIVISTAGWAVAA